MADSRRRLEVACAQSCAHFTFDTVALTFFSGAAGWSAAKGLKSWVGSVAEWLKAPVLKTGNGATRS